MRHILKHYFWVCESLFVLITLLLLAQTSSWAYALWNPKQPQTIKKPHRLEPQKPTIRHLGVSAIVGQPNLFNPKQGNVGESQKTEPVVKPKPKKIRYTTCDPHGSYVRTRRPFHLKGTVVASDQNSSMAAIYDAQRKQDFWVSIGKKYRDVTICSIEQGRITWLRQGRLEYTNLNHTPIVQHVRSKSRTRSYRRYRKLAQRYSRYAKSYQRRARRYERLSQQYPKYAQRYRRYARSYRRSARRYQRMTQRYKNKAWEYQW